MRRYDLDLRLIAFGVAVGRIVNQFPSDRLSSHIAGQLVRCGTAPIAHYAEAQGAESRRDFIHKLRLALKELRESLGWLRLAADSGLASGDDAETALRECGELIAILVASIGTATRNLQTGRGTPNRERRVRTGTDEQRTGN